MFSLIVDKYYSEDRGLLKLRYETKLIVDGETAWVEYISASGRKCKMKFYTNSNGYLWTSLATSDHSRISARLNRLIWSNAKGEIPKGYEIDHVDRNRKNNEVSNLRLLTKKENNFNKDIKGEKNGFSKLKEEQVKEILVLVLEHKMTKQEIADRYKVSFATIKAIRSGRNWLYLTKDIFKIYGIEKEVK